MISEDDYLKKLRKGNKQDVFDLENLKPGQTQEEVVKQETLNPQVQKDYFDMLKNQNYKEFLDKEIEAENIRARAMNATGAALSASGFGSQGYGTTARTGIESSYFNALAAAKDTYSRTQAELNLQEQQKLEAERDERFKSITTMISQAQTKEQINNLLTDYGYGEIKNGEFVFGEKPADLSEDDWLQIKYYYNLQKENLGGEYALDLKEIENQQNEIIDRTFGDTSSERNRAVFNDFVNRLDKSDLGLTLKDGDAVRMSTNKKIGDIFILYKGGKYYMIDREQFRKINDANKKSFNL